MFLILVVSMLWVVIHLKGNWLIKAVLTCIIPCYSVIVWYSIPTFAGWASNDKLPDKFELKWVVIEEPNCNSVGSIYVWVISVEQQSSFLTLLGYNASASEPRAYKIPYSRTMHEHLSKMLTLIIDGRIVVGVGQRIQYEAGGGQRAEGETDEDFFELPPGWHEHKD